jgi:hypothetical protein
MKWTEMLSCSPETLREHYAGVRNLAYNNANIAQGCCDKGRTIKKLARQMGFLMTQISMCENAARKRGLSLV